ncbi:MAG: MarR family transcriptional regulator [Myxococcales bacterium]|nr:MarR family transcriptional regulator [Myxococcales bacterium]
MNQNIIPTECPYYLISRVSLTVAAALKTDLTAADLEHVKPAYLGVLMALWLEEGLKTNELGRRSGLEPSTMTGLLDRMERDGFLIRRADPEDRRAQLIELTDLGRGIRREVTEVVTKTIARMFAGIPETDLAHLKETLRAVLANQPAKGES